MAEDFITVAKKSLFAGPPITAENFDKYPPVTEYILMDDKGYLYYCKHGDEDQMLTAETGTYLVSGSHDYYPNEKAEIIHKYFVNNEPKTLHRVLRIMAKMSFNVRRYSAYSRHITNIKKSNGWDFMLDLFRDSEIGRITWAD